MILDKMYNHNQVISAGMQAAILRNDVINNNLANSDVPGYKKKSVEFESMLESALKSAGSTDTLDMSRVQPRVKLVHEGFDYRIDGNNVDVDMEMVDLYQNSVRYETMVSCITGNSSRINLVLTGR